MGDEGRQQKQREQHTSMEGTWYPKKRPSLGENHQANVNKNINNDRDNTNAQYGTLSSINDDERNTTEGNKFYVDYSKRGTCKCKHCRKKIAKDEIRIGKSVEYKEKHILQYYHINCVEYKEKHILRYYHINCF